LAPRKYLQLINTNTGGPRNDITPLFVDYRAFQELIEDFRAGLKDIEFDQIAGIDAGGFILGATLAWRCKKGFIPVRKIGKLPVPSHSVTFVDYSGKKKGLEIPRHALKRGMKILLIDDWIETGSQIKAAIKIIEGQGAKVAGIATIHADKGPKTDFLFKKYKILSLMP
jgi:adenine phosphoribosyltransferase